MYLVGGHLKTQKNRCRKYKIFHRDIDNFNFIKVFLYLNDVDENSGPNQYLMYSHKKFMKKISQELLKMKELKKKNIFTFTGKSGDAI